MAKKHLSFWHPARLVATCAGVGQLPIAPGTWGSAAAFPLAFLIMFLLDEMDKATSFMAALRDIAPAFETVSPFLVLGVLLVLLFIAGTKATTTYMAHTGKKDPSEVVIDEVVGQLLVLLAAIPMLVEVALYHPCGFLWGLGCEQGLDPECDACAAIEVNNIANLVLYFALAFLFFRLCDIVKPWPANWIDKNMHSGFGVMLDDVVAGIYAAVLLYLTFAVVGPYVF